MNVRNWKLDVLDRLSDPDFEKRFLTTNDLADVVASVGGPGRDDNGNPSGSTRLLKTDLLKRHDLIRIQKNLYANMRARPVPHPAEAAAILRPGAVVSLHTVLGQIGALNNPTSVVYALFPVDDANPKTGVRRELSNDAKAEFGRYHFFSVRRSFLESGEPADNLDKSSYPRATPERAMVDWIRLSHVGGTHLNAPPFDLDMDLLDLKKLKRIAKAAAMDKQVDDWLQRKQRHDQADAEEEPAGPGLGR